MRPPIEERQCWSCGRKALRRTTMLHEETVTHDGRQQVIRVPDLSVIRCRNPDCKPEHPNDTIILDDDAIRRIDEETYRQLGLLTPDEIRENRERLGLTQLQLAELLRLGGNSLSRWESGAIYQSRSLDTLLRIVLSVPEAVAYLRDRTESAAPQAQTTGSAPTIPAAPTKRSPALGHDGEEVPEPSNGSAGHDTQAPAIRAHDRHPI